MQLIKTHDLTHGWCERAVYEFNSEVDTHHDIA